MNRIAAAAFAAPAIPAGTQKGCNCSDFAWQEDARNVYVQGGGPANDRHWLDDDKGGIVCELLPSAC